MRRKAVEKLQADRTIRYQRELARKVEPAKEIPFPERQLTYLGNVSNSRATAFYKAHGVESVAEAFELKPEKDVPLMFTKLACGIVWDGVRLIKNRNLRIRNRTICYIKTPGSACSSIASGARCWCMWKRIIIRFTEIYFFRN